MIPPNTLRYINDYVAKGYDPGSFLGAVLRNDLSTAVGAADEKNLAALVEIVRYVQNCIPAACWGSPQVFSDWIESKRAKDCPDCGARLDEWGDCLQCQTADLAAKGGE